MAGKRGDKARQILADTIIKAFGDDFINVADKKIYVWVPDGVGGERIQFAISATMPKTQVSAAPAPSSAGAWDDGTTDLAPASPPATMPTELSAEDRAKVNALLKELGL